MEVQFPIARTERYGAHVDARDHEAVVASLEPFFAPASVAVIGASKRRGSIGGELFRNILDGDFAGVAYPVNRDGEPVAGVRGYGSIEEIADAVDLAVITLPGAAVLGAAEQALREGVRALVVISAGFAEIGSEGAGAPGATAGSGALLRRTADRAQLPRHRGCRTEPQRHVRGALARPPATSASRRRAARSGSRSSRLPRRAASVCSAFVSIGNKAGRLDQRSARVVGGGRDDRGRAHVRRVVRQPAALRPPRPPSRPHEADPRAQERNDEQPDKGQRARTPQRWPAPRSQSMRSSTRPASFAPPRSRS